MLKFSICFLIIFLSTNIFSQKTENKIIQINGDDTLVFEFNGFKGNLDSMIEETLKSFYKIKDDIDLNVFSFPNDKRFEDVEINFEKNEDSDKKDSLKINIGKMKIVIIDDSDRQSGNSKNENRKIIIDKEIRIGNNDKGIRLSDDLDDIKHERHVQKHFNKKSNEPQAYWSGLSYGSNGMLNETGGFTNETDASYLKFDYVKSYEVQFNVLEKRFPVYKNYIGVSTGLGFKWNRFTLDNNSIDVNYNDTVLYSTPSNSAYKRSTLRSAYIQAPLLLELCSNKDPHKAWHLSLGLVGGLRIASSWRTKVGNDVTNTKGDFNFRPFTAHAVAILGYDKLSLYVNYGLSNVFEKNSAPETKMVSAGVIMHF